MHTLTKSIHHIDSCNVTDYGSFDLTSIKFHENPSRLIACRKETPLLNLHQAAFVMEQKNLSFK